MVRLLPIRLEISERLVRRLEKAARLAFPRETFALLLGEDAGTNSVVTDLYFPENVAQHATNVSVEYQPLWLIDAMEYAGAHSLDVLGDWHSHPYRSGEEVFILEDCAAPSGGDLESQRMITGITALHEKPSGRKYAKTRFWGPIVHVETVVTHGLH